jgi:hypothetical protein
LRARFYETCLGGAKPARRDPGGTLMVYDAKGFALALGTASEAVGPDWMHFGRVHRRGVLGTVTHRCHTAPAARL